LLQSCRFPTLNNKPQTTNPELPTRNQHSATSSPALHIGNKSDTYDSPQPIDHQLVTRFQLLQSCRVPKLNNKRQTTNPNVPTRNQRSGSSHPALSIGYSFDTYTSPDPVENELLTSLQMLHTRRFPNSKLKLQAPDSDVPTRNQEPPLRCY